MVSKTIDDLPDPDTPVKIVILRFGMRNDTFFRLFSRAPRILIYSWDTIRSFSYLTNPQAFPQYIVSGVEYHPPGSADPNVKFSDGKGTATKPRHFMERLVPQGRLVTENFAETGRLKKTPHNTCTVQSAVFMVERGWCIVLRSPRFTTFEPPEAASWAFQYRTAWRTPR